MIILYWVLSVYYTWLLQKKESFEFKLTMIGVWMCRHFPLYNQKYVPIAHRYTR